MDPAASPVMCVSTAAATRRPGCFSRRARARAAAAKALGAARLMAFSKRRLKGAGSGGDRAESRSMHRGGMCPACALLTTLRIRRSRSARSDLDDACFRIWIRARHATFRSVFVRNRSSSCSTWNRSESAFVEGTGRSSQDARATSPSQATKAVLEAVPMERMAGHCIRVTTRGE